MLLMTVCSTYAAQDLRTYYFGTGSSYVQGWNGYTASPCTIASVITISWGVFPTIFSANTIYLVQSGVYNFGSTTRTISNGVNCVAIIGVGDVVFTGNAVDRFLLNGNNIIIDNISVRNANNGIAIAGQNISVMNSKIFSNTNAINNNGNDISYLFIRNSKIYNNTVGLILDSLIFWTPPQISITNSEFYNNTTAIQLEATQVLFSMVYVYNNTNGITESSNGNNYFSGMVVYNNTNDGLNSSVGGSSLYNTMFFGNGGRAVNSTANTTYYGTYQSTWNTAGAEIGLVAGGGTHPTWWWSAGVNIGLTTFPTVPAMQYPDTIPDSFSFAVASCSQTGTMITSTETITLAGLTTSVPVVVSGLAYRVGAYGYTGTSLVAQNGDALQVQILSPTTTGQTKTGWISVGGFTTHFVLNTDVNCSTPSGGWGIPTIPICGNGRLQEGEQCDDGNMLDGDGCSMSCQKELPGVCGNGNLERWEQCDDENILGGDGCNATCQIETVTATVTGNLSSTGSVTFWSGITLHPSAQTEGGLTGLRKILAWYEVKQSQSCTVNQLKGTGLLQQSWNVLQSLCVTQYTTGLHLTTTGALPTTDFMKLLLATYNPPRELPKKLPQLGIENLSTQSPLMPWVVQAKTLGILDQFLTTKQGKKYLALTWSISRSQAVSVAVAVTRRLGKSPQILQSVVSQFGAKEGLLTAQEAAALVVKALGLEIDTPQALQSKNALFYRQLATLLATQPLAKQKPLLDLITQRIEKANERILKRAGYYKPTLVKELKQLVVK